MSKDLVFSSETEALQHLAEITNQKIVIAEEELEKDDKAEEKQEENKEERFRNFFEETLSKFDVESLDDLDEEQKSKFFAEIEAGWVSEGEAAEKED